MILGRSLASSSIIRSVCGLLLVGVCLWPQTGHAEFAPRLGASALSYATEVSPAYRLDVDFTFTSDEHLGGELDGHRDALREMQFHSFYETGIQGDQSMDLDPVVLRFEPSRLGHFWVGRTHPFKEGRNGVWIRRDSAVGASWGQNQSDPLSPRVSGWIGAGLFIKPQESSNVGLTLAYSPIYLPNFGPRLDLSDSVDAKGSRFARLPPQYVQLDNALVPLRYRVDTGAIREIVFQNQFFASIGQDSEWVDARLMGWSAPTPDPAIDTSGILRAQQDVNILVTARPRFPRENWVGGHLELKRLIAQPEIEALHDLSGHRSVLSLQLKPWRFLRTGALQSWLPPQAVGPGGAAVESPIYAKDLVWVEGGTLFENWGLEPSLRIERQFTKNKQGSWVSPRLEYSPQKYLRFFASASILSGQDYGYFGTWRDLDSVSMGARVLW